MSDSQMIFILAFAPLFFVALLLLSFFVATVWRGIEGELEWRRFMKENNGTDDFGESEDE